MQGPESDAFKRFVEDLQSGTLTYEEARKKYTELGDAIHHRYEQEVTALSLDVVNSTAVKVSGSPLDAQLTFDAYHCWVEERLAAHGCGPDAYTWAGDGLLAVFKHPEPAVATARGLIDGLAIFNARFNRLQERIEVRIGVHTGRMLPGEAPGVGKVASHTFDLAARLQKTSAPNQVAISETTYTHLKEGAGQFIRVPRELPGPAACFAYPPESVVARPGAEPEPALPDRTRVLSARPPTGVPPSIPWILAGAAAAAALVVGGLALGGAFSRPALQNSAATAEGPQPIVLGQDPPVWNGPPANDAAGGRPGGPAGSPAGNVPAAGNPPPIAVPNATPTPAWEPSRRIWRSGEADSGLPARFVTPSADRRWLVSIGVGSYRDRSFAAEGAGAHAVEVARLLQRVAGVPSAQTRVLRDDQATVNNIKLVFQWLQQNAASGRDLVFVYLAGAGTMAPERPGAGTPGGSAYALAPHDADSRDPAASFIYGTDLAAWLGATRAQQIIVLADTAHAGAMPVPQVTDQGRQYGVLASSTAIQRAVPGVFSQSLAVALSGNADANGDRRIALEELRGFLSLEVARRTSGAQTPEAHAGFGGFLPEVLLLPGG